APAVYIARVTTVAAGVNGAITLSTTAKAGTAPTSSATGRTIVVGGAWLGPNGATGFPFNFVTNALVDGSGNFPCVNLKNNATYNITAQISHTNAGPIMFCGSSSTVRDGGKATIDGGTSGASYNLLAPSSAATNCTYQDLILQNNGASGTASGFVINGT